MVKSKGIILSILLGSGLGFVSLLYKTTDEKSQQLICYPDARYINGVYIDVFRLTEIIYSMEIRKKDGLLIKEGYFDFDSDYEINVFDIISYDNGSLKMKNGTVVNIRSNR